MTSRLTVVTGPTGADIGPAVAAIGAKLADGLAVRVVNSLRDGDGAHTSPDPFHRRRDPDMLDHPDNHPDDLWIGGEVRLRYLPSAWQNPDTNLGVVFTGHAHSALKDDVHTLSALGLDPSHRLTVQSLGGPLRHDYTYPAPIEVGDLGVHARDAVLRAGGHVLIEAGDGMTHLEALAALSLPPWAPWVGTLDLWTVFDAAEIVGRSAPGERLDTDRVAARIADDLTRLGALLADATLGAVSRVAVLGLDDPGTLPDVDRAALSAKIFGRTGTGVDTVCVSDGFIQ